MPLHLLPYAYTKRMSNEAAARCTGNKQGTFTAHYAAFS
jgi:hypothetical protein